MLDPSMAWTATLDHHYYDQAQFIRDFQRFMGMRPGVYAARAKPILGAAALARAAAAGEAVQGLHKPQGQGCPVGPLRCKRRRGKIGSAAGRARVRPYVVISVVAVD